MDDEWTRRVWPPAEQPPGRGETGPETTGRGLTRPYGVPGAGGDAGAEGASGRHRPARDAGGRERTAPYGAPVSGRATAEPSVWPLTPPGEEEDELPPAARRYGAPATPPRRMPRWLWRLLVGGLALACSAAVIGAVVVTVLNRAERVPPTVIHDQVAGVAYTLPPEWREGVVAPVSGFTTVAARGDSATVMARPGDPVDPPGLRSEVIDLSDLYARLLLHGDKVEVLDDRAVTVGGRPGHTRAVRAEYSDVVNEPAFMRVTLLTRSDGGSTVLLGLAHPDQPRSRAEIEGLMWGAR
ncbi:hypothetical protein [Microbispora triticiradicis]|uniref:DUF1795 domain-containing protein n=3 Tax=Microbispora TaxID=2005 RepID=A0ABY3LWM8_9ACTN|nr:MULTISPECIES: hypothetical protein [Microbispora]TLP55605.1 hypothetical protein FED44_24445 [Microbispora fusca]TYB57948.1 hypothetical protein FXF59_17470 [Microbispora tritici]